MATETKSDIKSRPSVDKSQLRTVLDLFYQWEATKPHEVYLKQPDGDQWKDYTWQEVGNQARRMAAALKAMNLPEKSNIGLISKNCAHWVICDLAIALAGHVSVPFYPSLIASQLEHLLEHSRCPVLFVGKLDVWEGMKAGIPDAVQVISFPHYPGNDRIEGKNFLAWDDLIAKHSPLEENYRPALEDLRTIIYTSGTTGNPKGVMFDYYRSSANMEQGAEALQLTNGACRFFSYLPMCHIAERAAVEGGSLYSGGPIYFAESLDTFAQNLQAAQPTHFFAVPRIWTKFQMGILAKIPQKKLDRLLKLPIISGIIKKRIRKSLGLDSARLILTGAAPMPVSLIEWYKRLGIHIQEVYGMTENGGGCTIMPKHGIKMGTVGKPYDYVEVKIEEENNEILMRSEGVMTGYYREPEMTEKTFKNGWLRTGDMGALDEDGYLKITGRVKDMFKSAKGEYIVPGPTEWKFATNNDLEQVCVLGTGLPQPVAMVVLSELGQAKTQAEVKAQLEKDLKRINQDLVNYQRLKQIVVCREPWSVENGLLTPTLKIKRNILENQYQEQLKAWYALSETVIFE